MTEEQKMLQGILYSAIDETLLTQRARANELCFTYNQLRPSQTKQKLDVLQQLFGSVPKNCCIMQPFYCDYGHHIHIGENFFANYHTVILDCATVTFGNHVFIAPNCVFTTAGHPLDTAQRNAGLEYAYPITIEDDVWIGANVTVLPNVTIGKGSVIGAGSVVTKNIPSGVVAVGNPCRVIRTITEQDKQKYHKNYTV